MSWCNCSKKSEVLGGSYDFPKWHQIREKFGYGECYSDNFTIIFKNILKMELKTKYGQMIIVRKIG